MSPALCFLSGGVDIFPAILTFDELKTAVDRQRPEALFETARPAYFQRIDGFKLRQAKMLLKRHTAEIAAPVDFPHLTAAAGFDRNARPDRGTIALRSHQPYVQIVAGKSL